MTQPPNYNTAYPARHIVPLFVFTVLACTGCYSSRTLPISYDTAVRHANLLSPEPGQMLGKFTNVRERQIDQRTDRYASRIILGEVIGTTHRTIVLKPGDAPDQTQAKTRVTGRSLLPWHQRFKPSEARLLDLLLDPQPQLEAWEHRLGEVSPLDSPDD